jgi:hypothetical protein
MEKVFDINQFVSVATIQSVTADLTVRVRQRRKEMHISQRELAIRSGVTYASIRRFETSGEISLSSLIKIALALNCLSDFNELFKTKKVTNLKDYSND